MGKIRNFIEFVVSYIEMLLVLAVSIVFVWDSVWQGNQVALEIAIMGFVIYVAIWRLRFK